MSKNQVASRRSFLAFAGVSAPVAAVAVASSSAQAEEAVPASHKSTGLRKTEHVEKYLESARF